MVHVSVSVCLCGYSTYFFNLVLVPFAVKVLWEDVCVIAMAEKEKYMDLTYTRKTSDCVLYKRLSKNTHLNATRSTIYQLSRICMYAKCASSTICLLRNNCLCYDFNTARVVAVLYKNMKYSLPLRRTASHRIAANAWNSSSSMLSWIFLISFSVRFCWNVKNINENSQLLRLYRLYQLISKCVLIYFSLFNADCRRPIWIHQSKWIDGNDAEIYGGTRLWILLRLVEGVVSHKANQ